VRLSTYTQAQSALGGDIALNIVTDMPKLEMDNLFINLWKYVFIFERRFSRFLPSSELTLFNRSAGIKTKISSEFRDLLISAQKLGQETGGLYNPFITPALQRAGYVKSALSGYENDKQIDYTNRKMAEVSRLIIGDNWALIPYGTAIDLGGCGKGYLGDQLGDILKNYDIAGYWISLGGDVVTMGHDENGNELSLSIQNANNLSKITDWAVDCPTEHFAIATSGTFQRKGQNIPKNWHHIIDPETEQPAVTDIRLATVCADTALNADVLASCAIILGSEKAPAYLQKHGVKSALLQCIDNEGVVFEKEFGPFISKSHIGNAEEVLTNA